MTDPKPSAPDLQQVGAASSRIAQSLREAILSGEITPNQHIRQEEVAARLGASRLPVREALRMLEAEGLIEHLPHRGARVPALTRLEVSVIYQMRERLEPLALVQSMPHLDPEKLTRLDELQQEIESNGDLSVFMGLDREFHLLSYSGCEVGALNSMVTRLWNTTQHYRRLFVSMGGPARMWVVNAEHRLILDAIQRRDTVDAERYLSGHIRRTREELDRHADLFSPGT